MIEQINLSTNNAGTGHQHAGEKKKKKRKDPDIEFTMNSKWIIGLEVKCKAIKLLEDNLGENLHTPGMMITF